MRKWQTGWLYFLIIYSSLHLVRDVLQDSGVKTVLSTILVKKPASLVPSWSSASTYFIAVVEILLAIYCLRKKSFGKVGYLTVVIAVVTVLMWLRYWFFL